MSRARMPDLPLREGVCASAVALPQSGPWPLMLDFLDQRMPQVTRAVWLARMESASVFGEQGQALPADARYQGGGRMFYYRELAAESAIPFTEQILFQDDRLLIADKPHFLPVTPGGRYVRETLLTRLKQRTGLHDLSPVHRIDRETAGLVMFTLQPQHRGLYQNLFRDRQVSKVYEAVAPFRPDLQLPLIRRSRMQESAAAFMQSIEVAGEVNAETRIELLERLVSDANLARYALHPSTGQRHQLRVHMNALGLPIVGDSIYPELLPHQDEADFGRPLQLLARELRFVDPLSGQPRHFESGLRLSVAAGV
ncbi:pseudouridine synthase [Roseateles oligotrophus]|uniref:Pseudouridine synthase n=1 Tax=Roseateles oligotrophus TaxID=1769250 RepID=A0ABT2YKX4_9BURK|nr:pseudouridine synthase [Roseateles oligotrophus]MCV2370713.1 pseudouridine synthase [Roseateles oligotrophus]